MKNVNLFYISILVLGSLFSVALRSDFHQELSFYGFAESRATEINYNHPVVVDKILVKPGQQVKAGEVLLHLSRRKSKETLDDQGFRIAELKAEELLWQRQLENEIHELRIRLRTEQEAIDLKIDKTQKELAYKKSLFENLNSIEPVTFSYKPLHDLLEKYAKEKTDSKLLYESKIKGLEEELTLGKSPYAEQIRRYKAEQAFDESQKVQPIVVKAPSDGLVGNISCKEAEHIASYSTLMTFYEPHSGIIEGYVHEDLTLEVELGQQFTISSLKDEAIKYSGTVIGLGSRIVEIPSRLRKIDAIKAYGREVLIEITKENSFLQKEKVSIRYNPKETNNQ